MHRQQIILLALSAALSLSWLPYCLLCDLADTQVRLPLLVLWSLVLGGAHHLVLVELLGRWDRP